MYSFLSHLFPPFLNHIETRIQKCHRFSLITTGHKSLDETRDIIYTNSIPHMKRNQTDNFVLSPCTYLLARAGAHIRQSQITSLSTDLRNNLTPAIPLSTLMGQSNNHLMTDRWQAPQSKYPATSVLGRGQNISTSGVGKFVSKS